MKVADLAEKMNTTTQVVLETLKSLRLKAKDGDQELSPAVVSIIKGEIVKTQKAVPKIKEPKAKAEVKAKKTVRKTKEAGAEIKVEDPVKESKTKRVRKTDKEDQEIESKKSPVKTTVQEIVKEPVIEPVLKSPVQTVSEVKRIEKPAHKEPVSVKKQTPMESGRPRISKEPVITLKPLARRKKRPGPGGKEEARPSMGDPSREKTGVIFSHVASPTQDREAVSSTASPLELKPLQVVEDAAAIIQEQEAVESGLPDIEIRVPITVKDFGVKVQQKSGVVLKELMKLGVFAHINQSLDIDVVKKLTRRFGFNLAKIKTQEQQIIDDHKQEEDNPELLKQRAPVVTFMGHVDHGKTTLLDKIRKSKVADTEHGGITQHMNAYSVSLPKGRITFLDTPGHEAFTAMRARSAHITDLVVLVVAADEGVMPQTEEALDHARAGDVPVVVALNKIDRKNADIDRVKKELTQIGLMPEDWGGKTIVVPVSAVTGEGVDRLLEMILLEAELLELKANFEKRASGIVVEANLSGGKGVVTTLIVQSGLLKEGDFIVVGPFYGKVKAMFDDHERSIKEAGPSMPVEILGLPDVPTAGESFYVVADEKVAREISSRRQETLKNSRLGAFQKITLEELYSQIQTGTVKELNVIMKADVQGSLEALRDSLGKIPSDKVKIKFIHAGVGDINASDVILAVASKAIIIGFHVGVDARAKQELEKQPVDVRHYRIIYDAVNDIKNALEGMLESKTRKKFLSRIEIRQVFKLSKHGIVAGCYVLKGKVNRKAKADLLRNGDIIFSGTISSLKRFKDDVRDVTEDMECGVVLEGFDKYEVGDIIEAYELETIAQKL